MVLLEVAIHGNAGSKYSWYCWMYLFMVLLEVIIHGTAGSNRVKHVGQKAAAGVILLCCVQGCSQGNPLHSKVVGPRSSA
jgi:hypothetical protein